MKIAIDTTEKTITLLNPETEVGELLAFINKFGLEDYVIINNYYPSYPTIKTPNVFDPGFYWDSSKLNSPSYTVPVTEKQLR